MIFKVQPQDNLEQLVQQLETKILDKGRSFAKIVSSVVHLDPDYLARIFARLRPTLAGELVIDPITLSIDLPSTSASSPRDSDKTTGDKIADLLITDQTSSIQAAEIRNHITNLSTSNGLLIDPLYSVTLEYATITVTESFRINKQSLNGFPGTVHTFLGRNAYQINISGKTIGGHRLAYDAGTIRALKSLIGLGLPINVNSVLLNELFGIYRIIVEQNTSTPHQTHSNFMDFNIVAYEDKDVDIIESTPVII